ncbi:MAG: hypothetical protein IJV14_02685 [Lachnospiraceae bacterium]|nr:hypothetical protein [Lachnospiraceae bacterium]
MLKLNWKKMGIFAGGVLFGTAGIAILKSEDAKRLYTHVTAAVKRGSDSVMQTYTTLRENCGDINADADDINEERAQKKAAQKLADAQAVIEEYEARMQAESEAETPEE